MMKKLVLSFLVLIIGIGGGIVYYVWQEKQTIAEGPTPEQTEKDMEKVAKLLEEGKGNKAYEIIRKYDQWITPKTEQGSRWLQYLVEASVQNHNVNQLLIIREYFPEFLDNNEKANILVAREYIRQKRGEDFKKIRNEWRGRETKSFSWLLLDADKLVLEGNRNQSILLLESQKFEGDEEVRRLIHLAKISADRPRQSWEYLFEATKLDPNNAELRLYRAKFLEAANKIPFALSEYVTAAQLKKDNLLIRDELAEFLVRHYQYPQALEIWQNLIEQGKEPPSILLKAWFWSKLAKPIDIDWEKEKSTHKSLFLKFLFSLQPKEYWDQQAFEKIPNSNRYLRQSQEIFWLRILQFLKTGEEQKALELLQNTPFEDTSWHKELQTALQRVLQYRIHGTLSINKPAIPQKESDNLIFPFFSTLEQLAATTGKEQKDTEIPEDIRSLLTSEDAIAATLLAAGWFEAGLDFLKNPVIPKEYPNWVSYVVAQAIKQNRGEQEALNFAMKQPSSPEMDLYIAQLLIDTKNTDAALQKVNPLLENDDLTSLKGRWLKGMIQIQKNELDAAKQTVQEDPKLAESTYGKELLARIAIMQKDTPLAEKIYQDIMGQSAEAKSYFARKAFREKNWDEAQRLTEQLFLEFPNNVTVRENLDRIMKEKAKQEETALQ